MKKTIWRWAFLTLLLVLYTFCKFKEILSVNALSALAVVMALYILTFPFEEKIYCLFMFIPFYLYVYIKGFAFYNVIVIFVFFEYILRMKKISTTSVIMVIVMLACELFWQVYNHQSIYSYIIKWLLAVFVSINLMTNKEIKLDKCFASYVFVLGVALMGAFTIMQYGSFNVDGTLREKYAGGLGSLDQNTFSLYCLLGFIVGMNLILNKDERIKTFVNKPVFFVSLAVFSVICAVGGALMVSKTYFLVLVFWAILLIITNLHKPQKAITYTLVLCVGLVLIFALPQTRELVNSVLRRFFESSNISELTTGRFDILKKYGVALIENPLNLFIGAGLFTYNLYFNIDMISVNTGQPLIAHNMTLEMICGYGILGFCLLFFIYYRIFRKRTHVKHFTNRNRFIPLIIFIIFSQSIAIYREDVTHFVLLLLLLVATPRILRKEDDIVCKN